MCTEVLRITYQKARKDYHCNACYWLCEGLDDIFWNLSYREKRAIVRARRNGWKIKKGETYVRATIKDDGRLHTYRAIPAIDILCGETGIYNK